MVVSSRTPEGSPNRCPACGNAVRVEPSRPFGDAPCPSCGTLLWFVASGPEPRFFDPADPEFMAFVAARFGVDSEAVRGGRWDELGIDSLDLVELVLEWEERFGS